MATSMKQTEKCWAWRGRRIPFLPVASRRHELSVNQAVEVDDKRHMGHLNTQMP